MTAPPKIYKTLLAPEGRGSLDLCDTIEHEGHMWLVPKWLVAPEEGWRRPERIILLDSLPHQKTGFGGADYLLSGPLAKAALEGHDQSSLGPEYTVILEPDITLPGGEKLN